MNLASLQKIKSCFVLLLFKKNIDSFYLNFKINNNTTFSFVFVYNNLQSTHLIYRVHDTDKQKK